VAEGAEEEGKRQTERLIHDQKVIMSCELPSVYCCDDRKARKEHRCCECRGTIRPGEHYNYHHGIWDEPNQFKVCPECDELRAEVDAEVRDPEEKTAFGQLHESVIEVGDLATVQRFLSIKRQRGANIPDWMAEHERKLTSETI
jgi:hypothetical protein